MSALRENHEKPNDPKQKHLDYEACEEHGMFMDAGGFTDDKYEILLDIFRDAVASLKRASKDVRVAACRAARLGALVEMPSWVRPDGIFCSR